MIIRNVELETVCGITSTLPAHTLPEAAFAGKSNVGKSSLINALLERKSLARTSAAPGKTQTINFYRVSACSMSAAQRQKEEEKRKAAVLAGEPVPDKVPSVDLSLYFVDLPGYGYAKASAQTKEQWGKLIERYLTTSSSLQTVFLLIDIRHAPGANDCMMYDWIVRSGFEPVIIATKADKIKRGELHRQVQLIRTGLKCTPGTVIIPFSAMTKQGRDQIWQYLSEQHNQ